MSGAWWVEAWTFVDIVFPGWTLTSHSQSTCPDNHKCGHRQGQKLWGSPWCWVYCRFAWPWDTKHVRVWKQRGVEGCCSSQEKRCILRDSACKRESRSRSAMSNCLWLVFRRDLTLIPRTAVGPFQSNCWARRPFLLGFTMLLVQALRTEESSQRLWRSETFGATYVLSFI